MVPGGAFAGACRSRAQSRGICDTFGPDYPLDRTGGSILDSVAPGSPVIVDRQRMRDASCPFLRATVRAVGGRSKFQDVAKLRIVADAFEQELLTDIAEAEAIGENELAAEWRLELKTYRAAEKQAILEEQAWGGSPAAVRREALGRRRSDLP